MLLRNDTLIKYGRYLISYLTLPECGPGLLSTSIDLQSADNAKSCLRLYFESFNPHTFHFSILNIIGHFPFVRLLNNQSIIILKDLQKFQTPLCLLTISN